MRLPTGGASAPPTAGRSAGGGDWARRRSGSPGSGAACTRERGAAGSAPHDPADGLREKLAQAREAADDRDEFDASEGQPVDEIERTPPAAEPETEPDQEASALSLDERRRAIHEKAQQALGEMGRPAATTSRPSGAGKSA